MQWLDIESAPKDGTAVYVKRSENSEDSHLAVYLSRKDIWVSPDGAVSYEPTHWQSVTDRVDANEG